MFTKSTALFALITLKVKLVDHAFQNYVSKKFLRGNFILSVDTIKSASKNHYFKNVFG